MRLELVTDLQTAHSSNCRTADHLVRAALLSVGASSLPAVPEGMEHFESIEEMRARNFQPHPQRQVTESFVMDRGRLDRLMAIADIVEEDMGELCVATLTKTFQTLEGLQAHHAEMMAAVIVSQRVKLVLIED